MQSGNSLPYSQTITRNRLALTFNETDSLKSFFIRNPYGIVPALIVSWEREGERETDSQKERDTQERSGGRIRNAFRFSSEETSAELGLGLWRYWKRGFFSGAASCLFSRHPCECRSVGCGVPEERQACYWFSRLYMRPQECSPCWFD